MQHSEQTEKIIPALVKAQAMIAPAIKDAKNPHFNAKYADLASIWDACRGPLSGAALCITQDVTVAEAGVAVSTRLWHESGQWLEFGPLVIPLVKRDAHGIGSGTTYAKRYALAAALGVVADDDDDGNGATGKPGGEKFMDRMSSLPKGPAGISDMRTKVNAAVSDINAAADWSSLEAYINTGDTKKLAVKVCRDYPTLWRGDENSGFAGCLENAGDRVGNSDDVDKWIMNVEAAARAKVA